MTKVEYLVFEQAVKDFMSAKHGLTNLSTKCVEEEGPTEPYFSWRPCVCCGDRYGGDRYDCDGWSRTQNKALDFSGVCEDCVYYACYGRLGDRTMEEVEKT